MQGQETHYFDTLAQRRPNKPPITSILESPTSYLLCELTVDGRAAADCALCRDIIQSTCRVCLGNIGTGLATMKVVKQCSSSVFIVSVASSHLSEVWAAMTIVSSFEKLGTKINVLKTGQTLLSICGPSRRRIDGSVLNWQSFATD